MFYFNNHRRTSPNFQGVVAGLVCLSPKSLPTTFIESGELHDATHGVVHLDEDEIQLLKNKWEAKPMNLVLMRVSEGGKANLSKGPHMRWDKLLGDELRRAFILNVRDYSAITKATLGEFCSLNIEQAERVFSENLECLGPSLRRLFTLKPAQQLIALDILCQGYLATHGLIEVPTYCEKSPESFANLKSFAVSTEKTTWWLRGLGFSGLRQLEDALLDAFVPTDRAKEIVESLREGLRSKSDQNNSICKIRPLLKDYLP